MAARLGSQLWSAYCVQLEVRPLISRCLTGLVGGIVSDMIAQNVEAHTHRSMGVQPLPYDYGRTLRFVTFGFFVGTPLAYKWYDYLDRSILPMRATSPRAVITKVLMDQLLFAPIATAFFLVGIRVLEGRPQTALQFVREKYWPVLSASYMIWPLAHVINFAFVPSSQRILYLNVVSVLWGAILAHLAMEPPKQAHPKKVVRGDSGGIRLLDDMEAAKH